VSSRADLDASARHGRGGHVPLRHAVLRSVILALASDGCGYLNSRDHVWKVRGGLSYVFEYPRCIWLTTLLPDIRHAQEWLEPKGKHKISDVLKMLRRPVRV
jgi:hypothetical protein